jgi:hypothetical protein
MKICFSPDKEWWKYLIPLRLIPRMWRWMFWVVIWKKKSKPRPMKCACGSTDIYTRLDIGWDIDPEGEERQHLDKCRSCGKERMWAQRIFMFLEEVEWWEEWREPFFEEMMNPWRQS